jgi:hypothetical protein
MVDSFSGMIANRLRGEQRARLTRFYTEQGYPPAQAAAMAAVELDRRVRQETIDRPEPGYTGEQGRMLEREMYRANPSRLADRTTTPDAELPGYDPTRTENATPTRFDPVYNEVQTESGEPIVRFSRPMTQEDRDISRQTLPTPQGSSEGYRPPQPPSIVQRAMEAITGSRPTPQATAPSAQGPEVRDGRPAPAPADTPAPTANVPGGDYNDVFNVPYTPPAKSASPNRPSSMPLPPKRPESMGRVSDAPSGGGFFSGMFKDPYEGMSSKQLYEKYQDSPDNNGLYFRAAAKEAQERKDARPVSDEGMKRGGTVGSGHHKDAAIMKALEIIHHMLRRG